jgi:hypothetical protein
VPSRPECTAFRARGVRVPRRRMQCSARAPPCLRQREARATRGPHAAPSPPYCRGAWARVTTDQFQHSFADVEAEADGED